jgi:hypothetical protein
MGFQKTVDITRESAAIVDDLINENAKLPSMTQRCQGIKYWLIWII